MMPKRFAHAGLAAIVMTLVSVRAATPIRVMLLDGESAGPYHKWRVTTPVLKKELTLSGWAIHGAPLGALNCAHGTLVS